MPQDERVPRKRGRHALYASKADKDKVNVARRRERRRAQAAVKRAIRFHSFYGVEAPQIGIPSRSTEVLDKDLPPGCTSEGSGGFSSFPTLDTQSRTRENLESESLFVPQNDEHDSLFPASYPQEEGDTSFVFLGNMQTDQVEHVANNSLGGSEDIDLGATSECSSGTAGEDCESLNDESVNGREDKSDEESDLEFLLEEVTEMDESDLESESDGLENHSGSEIDRNTSVGNNCSTKEFLEYAFSHLCDCEEEISPEPAEAATFGLREMTRY
ncbi:hypothetical protein B7463_g3165, partial [Scytalidium lignicola]